MAQEEHTDEIKRLANCILRQACAMREVYESVTRFRESLEKAQVAIDATNERLASVQDRRVRAQVEEIIRVANSTPPFCS